MIVEGVGETGARPGATWVIGKGSTAVFVVVVPALATLLGLLLRYLAVASVHGNLPVTDYFGALCMWDCEWYLDLATTGYNPFPNAPRLIDHGNWAFFPLTALVVGAVLRLFPMLDPITLGSLTSLLLATLAVPLAWPLLGYDRRAYLLFAVLILCGPFSIYFTTVLSEALFMLLTIAVLAALQRRQILLAGVFAALLSGTRIVGVFIVLAIVLEAYRRHRLEGGTLRGFPRAALADAELVLAVAIAPLGLFCYMAFLHFWIGDALAFSHVQRAWAREVDNPLVHLAYSLVRFPEPASGEWLGSEQWLSLMVLAGLGLTAVLFVQRRFGEAAFALACLVLPLFTGVASMIRFIAALAPLNLLLATLLSRRSVVLGLSLFACLCLDYLITLAWIGGKVALI